MESSPEEQVDHLRAEQVRLQTEQAHREERAQIAAIAEKAARKRSGIIGGSLFVLFLAGTPFFVYSMMRMGADPVQNSPSYTSAPPPTPQPPPFPPKAAADTSPAADTKEEQRVADPDTTAPASAPDSLDKMATVFQGGYTREQIKSTLDQVMPLYGTTINEDGYRRCGSVLVEMTQQTGVPEMDQLNYMMRVQQVAPGGGMTFADGAALAASSLENKSH